MIEMIMVKSPKGAGNQLQNGDICKFYIMYENEN